MIVINYFTSVLGIPPVQRIFDQYLIGKGAKKIAEKELEDTMGVGFSGGHKGRYKVHTFYELSGCKVTTFEFYDVFRSLDAGPADSFEARIVFTGERAKEEAELFYQKFKDAEKIEMKEYKTKSSALSSSPTQPQAQAMPSATDLEGLAKDTPKTIFNPKGPNMLETECLIKTLTTVLNSDTWYEVKMQTYDTIQQIKAGFEQQSGQKYTGFMPDMPTKPAEQSQQQDKSQNF